MCEDLSAPTSDAALLIFSNRIRNLTVSERQAMLNSFRHCVIAIIFLGALSGPSVVLFGGDAIDVGQRLELFVDDFLIAGIQGDVKQHLVLPEAQDAVFETEEPWEGNTSGYYSFFMRIAPMEFTGASLICN